MAFLFNPGDSIGFICPDESRNRIKGFVSSRTARNAPGTQVIIKNGQVKLIVNDSTTPHKNSNLYVIKSYNNQVYANIFESEIIVQPILLLEMSFSSSF